MAVFIGAALYNLYTGLVVFMGDSYLLADRAKHLIRTGTLDVNNFGSIIYPPLYPIIISPAYFAFSPQVSFHIILVIHALMVAAQVLPYHRLLTGYANVAPRPALWLAMLFSLMPATLPYESMMLTEVLYMPLLLWLTWLYLRARDGGSWTRHAGVGLMLAVLLLVRPAASVVVIAYAVVTGLAFWRDRTSRNVRQRLVAVGCSLGALAVVYGTWKLYEAGFVHHQGQGGYFTLNEVRMLFTRRETFDLHFAWFANAVIYYLTAPLSLAACLVCVLFIQERRKMAQDALAPFAFLVLIGASVSVGLLIWGNDRGPDLTLNRYLMPYIFFLLLIAVRYRDALTGRTLNTCGLILGLLFFTLRPFGLGPHFFDALGIFTYNTNPFHLPAALNNLVFASAVYVPAFLWARGSSLLRGVAVLITVALWLGTDLVGMVYYRNSGDLNATRYDGVAKQAAAYAAGHPGTMAYFDPELPVRDYFRGNRILFYWPNPITPATLEDLPRLRATAGGRLIYFTDKLLPEVGRPKGREGGPIFWYLIDPLQLALARSGLTIRLGDDIPGEESSQWQGKPYAVRWLRQMSSFDIRNGGDPAKAVVNVQLSVLEKPRKAFLEVNGIILPDAPVVTHVFWVNGPQIVRYVVPLNRGSNHCRLLTKDDLDALPGGRRVAFLMADDISVARGVPEK